MSDSLTSPPAGYAIDQLATALGAAIPDMKGAPNISWPDRCLPNLKPVCPALNKSSMNWRRMMSDDPFRR
ncbi:hypothetical protein [Paramagnetospirillum marisnigri]|uniref:hypothetical protein n=1 Tax=Paramagnetospirillum marisnigri TaxID=1285242 RepID=UPI0012E755D1|nr:hypothetical protein [Paramagnetospirillum marisnigri]